MTFNVNKDSHDTLRHVHRALRDHYSAMAEQFHCSTTEAWQAATEGARITEAEREARLSDVEAELERLRVLRRRAVTLGEPPSA